MTLRDQVAQLANLYSITGHDWVLEVHHILTEPTCPTVSIRPEHLHITRYRIDCDSIEEGVSRAVDMVYREVMLREPVGHAAPFTNADDTVWFEELTKIWKQGHP